MVNDTTTLNGALSELGETMAANITTKGVSASASDGLTTLAGKILQISGDTPTPTPTVLFEDDCSTDNTSDWANSTANAFWEAVGNTYTLSFNTDHYELSHSPGSFLCLRIPGITESLDNYVLTADVLSVGTNTDYGGGLGIIQDDNKGIGMVQPNSNTSNHKHTYLYSPQQGSGSVISQVVTTNYTVDQYHTHRLTKEGTTIKYEILYNDNVIFTNTKFDIATNLATQTIPGITVGRWDTAKFKNIKLETIGSGSECSQYTTQINNAITYINGSGS